jgi:hypothetical protein
VIASRIAVQYVHMYQALLPNWWDRGPRLKGWETYFLAYGGVGGFRQLKGRRSLRYSCSKRGAGYVDQY